MAFLFCILLLACSCTVKAAAATNLIPSKAEGTATRVTFNKDVAPIVFARCSGCHRPGQAAPFSLLTYQDVQKRAKLVAEVVEKRYMPPWLPDKDCAPFTGDPSLTANQIETIRRWVLLGVEQGQPADLPPLSKWSEGWHLGTPDLIVKMPQPYTLAAEG